MSVWDMIMNPNLDIADVIEEEDDTIIIINISEEARAQIANSKDPSTIQANITNLTDGIAYEIEQEAMALLEDQE